MEKCVLVLCVCCVLAGCASETSTGDRGACAPTADESRQLARNAIESFLSDPNDPNMRESWLSNLVTCGPHLWSSIKDDPALADVVVSSFFKHFATIDPKGEVQQLRTEAESTIFRGVADVEIFWKVVLKKTEVQKQYRIRRPTEEEHELFAVQVPFVLEEPILVVEGRTSDLIINFLEEDGAYKPIWIDDLRDAK